MSFTLTLICMFILNTYSYTTCYRYTLTLLPLPLIYLAHLYRRDPYHTGPGDQRVGGAAGRLSRGGEAVAGTAV